MATIVLFVIVNLQAQAPPPSLTSSSSSVVNFTNTFPINIKKCKNVPYYPVSQLNFNQVKSSISTRIYKTFQFILSVQLMGKWYSINPVTKKLCETCQYTAKPGGTFMKVCKVLIKYDEVVLQNIAF